jgi:Uncharacterized protein conserved in bacteria (DUF2325)
MSAQTHIRMDSPPTCEAAPVDPGAAPEPEPHRPGRRRLWQLPTQAHELLLALSFTPDGLRREIARTLGQVHKGRCVLRGRDVDVLYSVVHDLASRNAVSEAMHRHLDARHAPALRAVAGAEDEQALRAVWAQALGEHGLSADAPAALWAVLTHPLGESVQTAVLYDARAWVFAHARRSLGQVGAQQQFELRLRQARERAEDLQARLVCQQQQAAEALEQARSENARLQGELARARASAAVVQEPAVLVQFERAPSAAAMETARPPIPLQRVGQPSAQICAQVPEPGAQPAAALEVAGRRVLCVGGIQHAVGRYRGRIERLGGHFEHHDGGIEDGIHALDARLGRADVVICQAACINHEAYHRVKRHCERTGTPCVYLDRPSLSRLDRALGLRHGRSHACC